MAKACSMRLCLAIPDDPLVGQILSTNGETAEWVTPDPYIDPWNLAGAIVFTPRGAALVLADGSAGSIVQIFDNKEQNDPEGDRAQNYHLYNIEPICVPHGGRPGDLLVLDCGRWQWKPMPSPCYCYGIDDVLATYRRSNSPNPPNTVYINVPWCACRGPNVTDVIGEVICKCFGIAKVAVSYVERSNIGSDRVYVPVPFCLCTDPNVVDVVVRQSRG